MVYREQLVDGPIDCGSSLKMDEKGNQVSRTIVKGPAVYIPEANEWVHSFSWHGSLTNGKGSQTGRPGDEKQPHALNFQKLRCMPDQMYYTVKDVRTKDDAQIQIHLMIFYEVRVMHGRGERGGGVIRERWLSVEKGREETCALMG